MVNFFDFHNPKLIYIKKKIKLSPSSNGVSKGIIGTHSG